LNSRLEDLHIVIILVALQSRFFSEFLRNSHIAKTMGIYGYTGHHLHNDKDLI